MSSRTQEHYGDTGWAYQDKGVELKFDARPQEEQQLSVLLLLMQQEQRK